jgi:hypothetical protein
MMLELEPLAFTWSCATISVILVLYRHQKLNVLPEKPWQLRPLLFSTKQDGYSKFRGELSLVFLRNSNYLQQKVSYGPQNIL